MSSNWNHSMQQRHKPFGGTSQIVWGSLLEWLALSDSEAEREDPFLLRFTRIHSPSPASNNLWLIEVVKSSSESLLSLPVGPFSRHPVRSMASTSTEMHLTLTPFFSPLVFFPPNISSSRCPVSSPRNYGRNDNVRMSCTRENCKNTFEKWEVKPAAARRLSSLQPFSIISAQTSLLKRVKLKPQFWKLQNSIINAQLSPRLRWVQAWGETAILRHTHTHTLNVYMQRERSRCTQKKCCMYPHLLYAQRVTLFKYKHVANAPETGTHTHTYSHGRGNTGVFYISRSGHLGDIGITTGFQQLFPNFFTLKDP